MTEEVSRVLIVDDEPKWGQKIKRALEQYKEEVEYQVEKVPDIQSALASSQGKCFNLILVNAALAFEQDTPGFKELVRLCPDKVLVISDTDSLSAHIKALKSGADYAQKPFETKRAVELVVSRLQRKPNAGPAFAG
jgi:DNA-binding response OmpR family regulator